MIYKFFDLLGCSKFKRAAPKQEKDIFTSLPLLENDKAEEAEPNLLKNLEMFGYSQKGFGLGKTNCQDSCIMLPNLTPNLHFFAVYDGHGAKGKEVSDFVNKQIGKSMKNNAPTIERLKDKSHIPTLLKRIFKVTDRNLGNSNINITNSGACCIDVLIYKETCFIANLGDCRAVLCRENTEGRVGSIELSKDHKPTREDEKARILEMGGQVEPVYLDGTPIGPLRVWTKEKEGGMAMTRAMGDVRGKRAGVISEPEIHKIELTFADKFIIVGSDGLWDVFSSKEAVSFVVDHIADGKPKEQVVKEMLKEATKRWKKMDDDESDPYCDDITIIVAFLNFDVEGTEVELPTVDSLT
jgi:serine/threonine protein phosphatase PrpC